MTESTQSQTAADLTDRMMDTLEQEVEELKQELANLRDERDDLTRQLNTLEREYKGLNHDFDRLELYASAAVDILGAPHDTSNWAGVASAAKWLLHYGMDSFNDGEPLARILNRPTLQPLSCCNPQENDDDRIPF